MQLAQCRRPRCEALHLGARFIRPPELWNMSRTRVLRSAALHMASFMTEKRTGRSPAIARAASFAPTSVHRCLWRVERPASVRGLCSSKLGRQDRARPPWAAAQTAAVPYPGKIRSASLIAALLASAAVGGCRVVHIAHAGSAGSGSTGHTLRTRLKGATGAAVAVEDTPGALGASLAARKRQRHACGRGQNDHLHRLASSAGDPITNPTISQRTGARIGRSCAAPPARTRAAQAVPPGLQITFNSAWRFSFFTTDMARCNASGSAAGSSTRSP